MRKFTITITIILILAFLVHEAVAKPALKVHNKVFLSHSEKTNLRRWMHALSLSLFTISNNKRHASRLRRWGKPNRDCSGFIRYIIWEAFQKHDEKWRKNYGSKYTQGLKNLYPTKAPSFYSSKGKSTFVDAYNLWRYNTRSLGKETSALQEGDLLFFFNKESQNYHTMLVIRNKLSHKWMIIYHPGWKKNSMKMMPLKKLFDHPDSAWHPHRSNSNFLGFYRLNFLSEY